MLSTEEFEAKMQAALESDHDMFPPSRREQLTGEMARTLANRENAKKSTGPRTAEGKAAYSRNRLAHGLCSNSLIIGGETVADFEALLASVRKAYNPVNDEEAMLTDQLTQALWRFNRAQRVETQVFQFSQLNRLASSNYNNETEHEFDELSAAQGDRMLTLAFYSDFDYKQIERITRYITTMERSYQRALKALQHAQEKRRNLPKPAEVAKVLEPEKAIAATSAGFEPQNQMPFPGHRPEPAFVSLS